MVEAANQARPLRSIHDISEPRGSQIEVSFAFFLSHGYLSHVGSVLKNGNISDDTLSSFVVTDFADFLRVQGGACFCQDQVHSAIRSAF